MALINCTECGAPVSEKAASCPQCGNPLKPTATTRQFGGYPLHGFEWKSNIEMMGLPLIHVAFGRDKNTGKLLVAKGIIAIGQYGIGLITIAQFGIGLLFGFGQFVGGIIAIGQFSLGIYFGAGQFATGLTAIGQFAFGKYVLAQAGYGEYVWSVKSKSSEAIEYFTNLWNFSKNFFIGK